MHAVICVHDSAYEALFVVNSIGLFRVERGCVRNCRSCTIYAFAHQVADAVERRLEVRACGKRRTTSLTFGAFGDRFSNAWGASVGAGDRVTGWGGEGGGVPSLK